MEPAKQDINPILQREIGAHHPATSVSAILDILQAAEQWDLISQAELFRDMEERDAHIFAEMNKRKMAVAQLDWDLVAPKDAMATEKKAIANLKSMIDDAIDINTLVFGMADGIGHGFSAHEIAWTRNDKGLWMPGELIPRPQRWFTVDVETRNEIRLRNNTIGGDALIDHGWILHLHSSKAGSPATQGLYRALALPYLFKNFAVKNWLRFCELYGVPIRVLFHQEKDPVKKAALLRALKEMGANGVALLEGGLQEDLKTVDSATGEGQGFKLLVDWAEESISKAILGGTLTTSSGKNGNYATAQVHDDVRYQIRDQDAKQIAETLTKRLLGSIITLNGLNIRPRWVFDTQEPEDLSLYADAIPKLVSVGFKIPTRYIYDKLKVPMPEAGEEVLTMQSSNPKQDPQQEQLSALSAELKKPVKFTSEQQVIEDMASGILNTLNSPIDPKAIASAIRAAKSPEDLEARLAVVLKESDTAEFSRVLERSLFAADILGYAHAG
jgi:phage gp29-like protein